VVSDGAVFSEGVVEGIDVSCGVEGGVARFAHLRIWEDVSVVSFIFADAARWDHRFVDSFAV